MDSRNMAATINDGKWQTSNGKWQMAKVEVKNRTYAYIVQLITTFLALVQKFVSY
jgi:hypothetical protein